MLQNLGLRGKPGAPSAPDVNAAFAALDRLSREIAAVQRVTETEAIKEIEAALAKGPRRGPKPSEDAGPDEPVE